MNINDLRPPKGSRKPRKRVGRGQASGTGCTAGRGNNGQGSRSGGLKGPGFEGGQMPLQRRLPKKGFFNIFRQEHSVVKLGDIAAVADEVIDPEVMIRENLVRKVAGKGIKVLAVGEIDKAKTIKAHAFSKAAKMKIEAANGKAEVIAIEKPSRERSDQ